MRAGSLPLVVLVLVTMVGTTAAAPLQMDTRFRAVQPGEVVRLTITTGDPLDTMHVRAFGQDIPVARLSPVVWEALIGIDLDVMPGAYEVSVEATAPGQHHASRLRLDVTARRFRTRRLTVADGFVNPSPDAMARIEADAADLDLVWTMSAPERYWTGPFGRPVTARPNSAFGTRSIFNGEPRQPHGGADFPSPTGTPIAAPGGGRVVLVRDLYFTGQTVVLDHGLGLYSLFAHLSRSEEHTSELQSH